MIGVGSDMATEHVLGCLCLDQDAVGKVAGLLTPKMFQRPVHRQLFQAALELFRESGSAPVDQIIRRLGDNDAALELVDDLQSVVGSVETLDYYAGQVIMDHRRRQLAAVGRKLTEQAGDPTADPDEIMARFQAGLGKLDVVAPADRLRPLSASLEPVLRGIEERRQNGGGVDGLETGVSQLDLRLAVLRRGEYIGLGGQPSTGKTALGLQVADAVATAGHKVLFYSLEMPTVSLVERLLARRSGVSMSRIRAGLLAPENTIAIENAGNQIHLDHGDRLIIDDRGSVSPSRIASDLQRESARGPVGLVVVDHLQLMQSDGRSSNRYESTTQISGDLKRLAMRYQVPVLALSQLSRQVNTRADKRPALGDLRDSGAIEQDCDVVIFIWTDDTGGRRLAIAKNRQGPTGDCDPVTFDPTIQKFS